MTMDYGLKMNTMDNIYVINADEFKNNKLKNVTINQLDKDFNLKSIIISAEANIEKK